MKLNRTPIKVKKITKNIFIATCQFRPADSDYNPMEVTQKGESESEAIEKLNKFLGDDVSEVESFNP